MNDNTRKQLIEGLDEMLVSALDVWIEQELDAEQRTEFDRRAQVAFGETDSARDYLASKLDYVCEAFERETSAVGPRVTFARELPKKARGKGKAR